MKRIIRRFVGWLNAKINGEPGTWKKQITGALSREAQDKINEARIKIIAATTQDYDGYVEKLMAPAPSAAYLLMAAVESGEPVQLPGMKEAAKVEISRARLFEARFDDSGRVMPSRLVQESDGARPWRVVEVVGTEEVKKKVAASLAAQSAISAAAPKARDVKSAELKAARAEYEKKLAEVAVLPKKDRELAEAMLREDFVDTGGLIDGITTHYDRSQFTEFAPLFGNQFFKQQYFHDMLQTFAYAYEAWNHNPVAKRIVNILKQYVIGRGVKLSTRNDEIQNAWDDFDEEFGLLRHLRLWMVERIIYGELMLDKTNWHTIDPSSIWEIVHVPEDVEQQLYYFQAFLSDYQMFVGYKVPGAPGSEKVPTVKFQINQIPAEQVLHLRGECVSNEKRGRSVLFPILGWLKRYKDLMTAEVIQKQLQACFIWDDTITGDDADVLAHASQYAGMPVPGSVFAHNDRVKRTAVEVSKGGNSSGGGMIGEAILAFIATAIGLPKEFLNVVGQGGGSRATALVGSEPFTKVVDELQTEFNLLLHEIAKTELPRRGVMYDKSQIEFVFPSVTKDTATEVIKNIMNGEAQGYISQRTAGVMFGAEMSISNYDFDREQLTIKKDKSQGLDLLGPMPPPPGRTGAGAGAPPDGAQPQDDGSDIHGDGKVDLKQQLSTI